MGAVFQREVREGFSIISMKESWPSLHFRVKCLVKCTRRRENIINVLMYVQGRSTMCQYTPDTKSVNETKFCVKSLVLYKIKA